LLNMKKNITKINFNAGQLSPELNARIDVNKYDNGFKEGLNVVVSPRGSVAVRPGLLYKHPIKNPDGKVKLLRFEFAQNDCYLIECGVGYFRFVRNGKLVTTQRQVIDSITEGVITATAHGLSDNTQIILKGYSDVPVVVSDATTNTFKVLDLLNNNPITEISATDILNIYEVSNQYVSEEELKSIAYKQYGDLIYITHEKYPLRILTRTADAEWSYDLVRLNPPPTYVAGDTPNVNITLSGTTVNTTVNATASSSYWLQADVGRQIIFKPEVVDKTGVAVITKITSGTVAQVRILTAFSHSSLLTGEYLIDQSPVCSLKASTGVAGSYVTIDVKYPDGFLGDPVTIVSFGNYETTGVPRYSFLRPPSMSDFAIGDKVYVSNCLGTSEANGRSFYLQGTHAGHSYVIKDGNGSGANLDIGLWGAYQANSGVAQKDYTGIKSQAFRSSDIGKYIILNGGVILIKEVVNSSQIKGEVLKSLTTTAASGNWSLEVPSWSEERGYPRAIGFFQQRLVLAGTKAEPLEIYFSETGIFEGFGRGTGETDAIQVKLPAEQVNQINWIASTKVLNIGTSGAEITIDAPATSGGISSTNIKQETRSTEGSGIQIPSRVGNELLFINRSMKKVCSFRYDFSKDTYISDNLNFLSPEITESKVIKLIATADPEPRIFAVTEDGKLLICTYNPDQEVIGWTKHDTNGFILDVESISEDDFDQVYFLVQRKGKAVIERLDLSKEVFTDSAIQKKLPLRISNVLSDVLTITNHGLSNGDRIRITQTDQPSELEGQSFNVEVVNSNTIKLTDFLEAPNYIPIDFTSGICYKAFKVINNLNHLEGLEVLVKNEGYYTVTEGKVTLDEWVTEHVTGLAYNSFLELLDNHIDIGMGVGAGVQVRNLTPCVKVYQSAPPKLNHEGYNLRDTEEFLDDSPPLKSGLIKYEPLEWIQDGALRIEFKPGLPCNLLGIFGTVEINPLIT
jgi:hypothetical protein